MNNTFFFNWTEWRRDPATSHHETSDWLYSWGNLITRLLHCSAAIVGGGIWGSGSANRVMGCNQIWGVIRFNLVREVILELMGSLVLLGWSVSEIYKQNETNSLGNYAILLQNCITAMKRRNPMVHKHYYIPHYIHITRLHPSVTRLTHDWTKPTMNQHKVDELIRAAQYLVSAQCMPWGSQ